MRFQSERTIPGACVPILIYHPSFSPRPAHFIPFQNTSRAFKPPGLCGCFSLPWNAVPLSPSVSLRLSVNLTTVAFSDPVLRLRCSPTGPPMLLLLLPSEPISCIRTTGFRSVCPLDFAFLEDKDCILLTTIPQTPSTVLGPTGLGLG